MSYFFLQLMSVDMRLLYVALMSIFARYQGIFSTFFHYFTNNADDFSLDWNIKVIA